MYFVLDKISGKKKFWEETIPNSVLIISSLIILKEQNS